MPILQYWHEVWQRAKEYGVYNDFPTETATIVNQYADEAYRACVRWFGPPTDAQKHYKIMQGERSFFTRDLGQPVIVISKTAVSKEQLCEIIAHEMYHRVTEGRKGLANELWVKEMMALLTSQWFLQNQGFRDYVDATKKILLAGEGKADVSLLLNATSNPRQYVLSGTPIYSQEFVESVQRIGYALNKAVDFEHQATLIKHDTLEKWIYSLPQQDQYAACRVLALPTKDKTIPCDERGVRHLFLALQAVGDKRALVEEFEHLVRLQPTNSVAFFYLGYALQVSKRFEDALRAYGQAENLGYSDRWLVHNIGSLYWQTKNYELAAEWFRKAAEQSLDWAQPRYFLGRALNNLGNLNAAREAWEEVLTLSDEDYAQLAAKSLEENPLPETAE